MKRWWWTISLAVLGALPVQAQAPERHARVDRVEGDTLYVQMVDDYRVEAGTEGRVYQLTTVGGEEQPIFTTRLRVSAAEGGIVRCEVIEQSGPIEDGSAIEFESVSRPPPRGVLVVRPRPEEATVYIDDEQAGTGRIERTVSPGTYQVRVEAEGYEPMEVAMTVRDDSTSDATFPLEQRPGQLIVRTEPDSATVFIDGQEVGPAPVERPVGAGTYQVRAEKQDFNPAEFTVRVEADATRDTTVQLQPLQGTLYVQTRPDSVTVFVDGEPVGITPLRASVSAGERTIRLARNGYRPVTFTDSVRANRVKMLEPRTLEPLVRTGQLAVDSTPDGAVIRLDGQRLGRTPHQQEVEVGTYRLQVEKERYNTAARRIVVEENATQAISISLTRQTGTLAVTSEPTGAEVLVDGERQGNTPYEAKLPTGEYAVRVALQGYESVERAVTVKARTEERVGVMLQRPLDVLVGQQPEVIRGATIRRDGGELIVTYDLVSEDEDDEYEIELLLSTDGESTYDALPAAVRGDVGDDVQAGRNRQIRWAALEDFPTGLKDDTGSYRLRIAADKEGNAGWWVFGSVVTLGGGAAAAVLTGLIDVASGGGDSPPPPNIPTPPVPPGN